MDEKDDTLSANNRSYVYSPKREMQPWLLTKSVEVKVAPTAPTDQVVPKSTENIATSTAEMTTRSNDEQQQTWNNIIVSDWLTERRTTMAEDDGSRITAFENTENNLNIKYTPVTETSVSTESNTDSFITEQENRTKTMVTTSDTTSADLVTEVISEHVTETGTELNTVITETPYTDKLVTIVFREMSPVNEFTTTSDGIYNDKSRTEMSFHFVTENTGNLNIPFTSHKSQNSEVNVNEDDKIHSTYELTNEVKRYVSTESSYIETSSEFAGENNTVFLTENGTGITSNDYETTTDAGVVLTEVNETKTDSEGDKSGNSRTKNNVSGSPEEMILTTTNAVGPTDLVTQSVFTAENESLNENKKNVMLKDTSILVNMGNNEKVFGSSERNVATVDNNQQNPYSKEEDATTDITTLRLNDEHSLSAQSLQSNLVDSQRERENETINNNESITESIEKVHQTDVVDSLISTDILQHDPTNFQIAEQNAEPSTKHSNLQESQQSDEHTINVSNENSDRDHGDAEEIGTEINSFKSHSDDGNKNIDDYSYEPPVLELNSQLPFLQIGGHGSMEIVSTDGSEENGTPEIENIEFSVEDHINNKTTEGGNEEHISSSTHIPLTPGDLKILAEYLINEKIKPTKNESSTYMPTEWLKGNLTSNATKIATILSAANISIGIINRNKSDNLVKLTDGGSLENKTLLQENVTTQQTLETFLNNKDSVTEMINLVKNENNRIQESDDPVVTLPSSLEVTNIDNNETVNTEGITVTEILYTTSYYIPNKDNSFVENLNESNQIQHISNKSVEEGEPRQTIEVNRIAENKTDNNENFNSVNEDVSTKNVSLPMLHTNTDAEKIMPAGENGSTKSNEVDSPSLGKTIKQDNKELYENVYYPVDNSNNTSISKNLSNHKKRINPGDSDEYTSRKVRIPEMESIVKEPFSASLDDNDLTILKEFLKKHMVIP